MARVVQQVSLDQASIHDIVHSNDSNYKTSKVAVPAVFSEPWPCMVQPFNEKWNFSGSKINFTGSVQCN